MKRLQKLAILLDLGDAMKNQGSWCGETHYQKAAYFLQELLKVPLDYEFVLYKHGPFSFDLRDELTALRAYGLVKQEFASHKYRPKLLPSENSANFREKFPKTRSETEGKISFVANKLRDRGVYELEKLATALYVTLSSEDASIQQRANAICKVKPHIPSNEALAAIEELDGIRAEL